MPQPVSNPFNLRVYGRHSNYTTLLWDKREGAINSEIEIFARRINMEGMNGSRSSEFKLNPGSVRIVDPSSSEVSDLKANPSNTVVCVIKDEEAGLDPRCDYNVKVRYAGMEQMKDLLRHGQLPDDERDDSKKNMHIFGWDKKKKKWTKITGVETDNGNFALLTSFSPCPNCGYSIGDK